MPDFTIYIGNRNYSSWSLRAWLALKATGAAFDEVLIPLQQPQSRTELLRLSPSGRVPVLMHGGLVLWESLAIGEYLAELFPAAQLLPEDRSARALARVAAAEVHAGFHALREHFPMNMRSSFPGRGVTPEVQAEINRITASWRDYRRHFASGGNFLFGHFTLADAMYAPVVSRFRTYAVEIEPEAQAYADAVWAMPAMQEWLAAARKEPMIIDAAEF
jgi:glutathione S-transferase